MNAIVHSVKTAHYSTNILHALLPSTRITSQTLFLVNLNPHHFHPLSILQISYKPFQILFANKIGAIRYTLNTNSTSLPTCRDLQFLGQPLTAFHPVSEATVKNINRQSSIKTCEFEPLPASFSNQCLDIHLPYTTTAANGSLLSGFSPESLKTAIVRPLLKKPFLDSENVGDCRPVLNPRSLSKITEKSF